MKPKINRRKFIKKSLLSTTAGALAASGGMGGSVAHAAATNANTLPAGKIKNMSVSRLLLGGNLLTHYTHS